MLLAAEVVLFLVLEVQIAAHLESLLQQPGTPQSALDDAHLLASALRQNCCIPQFCASSACYFLLMWFSCWCLWSR